MTEKMIKHRLQELCDQSEDNSIDELIHTFLSVRCQVHLTQDQKKPIQTVQAALHL